jgi:hypothetical protein
MRQFAPLLALVLGACANDTVIATTAYEPNYTPGEASMYGAVPMIIGGTPLPALDRPTSDAVVLSAMQGQGFHHDRFVLGPVGRSSYMLAVYFNPAVNLDSRALCDVVAGKVTMDALLRPLPNPPLPRLPVIMALCRSDQRIAGAYGTMPMPAGPDDATLKQSLGAFALAVIPAVNPMRPNLGPNVP